MRKIAVMAMMPLLLATASQAQTTTGPIEMVKVPGGCFKMGSDGGEKHERPVHEVCVKDFELGKTEVTQGQWKAVMGTNPSKFANGDLQPVEMVSWNDTQEFLKRLNANGTGTYRLPTEAEWEYACRSGGKDETYPGGVAINQIHEIAWFNKDDAGNTTHQVSTKKANGLGLYDMAGNVWEWVEDKFVTPYGGDKPESKHVIRGGSWDGKVSYVRCAIRNRYEPDRRDARIGLRVARDPR